MFVLEYGWVVIAAEAGTWPVFERPLETVPESEVDRDVSDIRAENGVPAVMPDMC